MNYPSINEYKEAILFAEDNFEQLKNLRPVLEDDGSPVMTSGNFAVVFKMKDEETGKLHAVKCFLKEQEGRAEAYRMIAEELEYVSSTFLTPIKYLDKELFVDTNAGDEKEFPVLLMDWVEGETLDKYIRKHLDDQYELSLLAYQFSRLAMWLMPQPFAHGDLKPDNILVRNDGTLVLVDYDGMYVPAMKGQRARELGSPDFRHPSRTETDFDEHIDDFSLASILLSLKAISLQPSFLEEYGAQDRLLFSEKDYRNLSESEALNALRPLMQDAELASLYSLFILALSHNNLSQVSFRLLSLSRPQIPILLDISEYCAIKLDDVEGYEVDKYGAVYSHDHKVLLKLPYHIIQYNVEEGTEIIATGAFDHFNVTCGGGVVDISEAFLENLYLPSSVKYITESAFLEDGRRIKEIRVETKPDYFKSYLECWSDRIIKGKPYEEVLTHSKSIYDVEGAEYSQDGKTLISLFWLSPDISCYQIKEGTKTIKFGAAQLAKKIHEIVVPSGVEYIEGAAFVNSSLSSIKLPLTLRPFDSDIFCGCNELKSIVIPEGTKALYEEMVPKYIDKLVEEKDTNNYSTKIEKGDFETAWVDEFGVMYSADRKRLLKAPEDVALSLDRYSIKRGTKVICNSAFRGCEFMQSVFIPDTVTKIGDYAFSEYCGIENIAIPNSVVSIGRYAFQRCSDLAAITLPDSVKSIGEGAFSECFNLIFAFVPDSVKSIGNNTFEKCEFLEHVRLPEEISEISDGLFQDCGLLKALIIPDSVVSIGSSAFYGCINLNSIEIPENVAVIEDCAFEGCNSIETFYLPKGIKHIGDKAFSACESLEEITILGSFPQFGCSVFHGCENLLYINVIADEKKKAEDKFPEYTIREIGKEILSSEVTDKSLSKAWIDEYGVKYSNDKKRLLEAPQSLEEYSVKEGTILICNSAFEGCKKLSSLHVPESVIKIGKFSFADCFSLHALTLPNGITSIGESAFLCTGLQNIDMPSKLNTFGANIFRFCSQLSTITLPNNISDISYGAFWGCKSLTSIILPPSVINISEDSFRFCESLHTVIINSIHLNIGENAFYCCNKLSSIFIPVGTKKKFEELLPKYRDKLVEQDEDENLSTDVTDIDLANAWTDEYGVKYSANRKRLLKASDSFEKNNYLIGEGVRVICNKAFYFSCLTSIHIPVSVTSIGDSAFYGCSGLTSIHIPDSVKSIEDEAFSGCEGLTTIHIPDSVTSIGDSAFSCCRSLRGIHIPDSVTTIGVSAFWGCSGLTSIHIPDSVTNIGDNAFSGCSGLTRISVGKNNKRYCSDDSNSIIEKSSRILLTGCKNTIIPDSVTSIGDEAFSYCSGLTFIHIPDSVTNIGYEAFLECSGLTSIHIPDSITSIEDEAFSGCRGLTNIHIPDSVTSIGDEAFADCRGLSSIHIPDSVTKIGDEAFVDCSGLISIYIPDSVTSIGISAFKCCRALTRIIIPIGTRDKFEELLSEYKDELVEELDIK